MTDARGITFGDHMVRALLAGKKTATRRLVATTGLSFLGGRGDDQHDPLNFGFEDGDGDFHVLARADAIPAHARSNTSSIPCPLGAPGQQLYVREAWRVGSWDEGVIAVDYRADGHARREWLPLPDHQWLRLAHQSADDCEKVGLTMDAEGRYHWPMGEAPTRWRLPRYMPRVASRLTLEVTDVWPERLHSITEDEAISEGMTSLPDAWLAKHWPDWWAEHERVRAHNARLTADGARFGFTRMPLGPSPLTRFKALWGELHTAPGTDWDSNPWVWRVGVRVVAT
ncbi:hypothetical protein GO986_17745 [Deinococcus sp. HMF7620]|uniref:Uncharacterized protein n=1 Tax=Deinococcus arboris TaxID=2682977 RepID=A0A7C9M3Y0_9DEIO|nr:hypothetical protein [Deinococcus arboris]MVN88582.1 hypothetical protein [Deinococcus arboris]